jgi:hypothetical protein
MTTESTAGQDEKVRARAYMIWETEGRPDGKHLEHWHQAERAIAAEPLETSTLGVASALGRKQPSAGKALAAPDLTEAAAG